MVSIREKYKKEVVAEMKKKLGFKNDSEAPKIEKVVVNVGIGKFIKDSGMVSDILESLKTIVGQKPLMTKSKKSIAGFKIREGLEVGMKATLRGKRMWDFIEKLVSSAIPRIRDFQGIKESSVDSSGNLNLGIKEHLIFPEILPEQVKNIFSLEVNITTSAKNREEGMALFRALGFPIEKK
ncbi:MAG: 50S ribosomal protein L5 [Candidatus Moranbacteria bacterium RIFOXYA12_FULL_44_15]|nr:MAG: 50S ribosomal protein L5 [Candidatus Moranbacteria bacterium RIFOXYA12_FULL_44_15]OGI34235.1 MAG: 50S ribosomal protein L5 [Candidatus Moranbacteria bacterium RIFOXYA2_FULL_43_15]